MFSSGISRKANDSVVFSPSPLLNGKEGGMSARPHLTGGINEWNRKYKNIFQLYKLRYNRCFFFWVPTDHISVSSPPGGFRHHPSSPASPPTPRTTRGREVRELKGKKRERKSAVKKDSEKKRTFANTHLTGAIKWNDIYIFYRSFHFSLSQLKNVFYKHREEEEKKKKKQTDSKKDIDWKNRGGGKQGVLNG